MAVNLPVALNMFTLIAIGISQYLSVYSLFSCQAFFPEALRGEDGAIGLYFEAAAVIVTLILLGQVMELRARNRTSEALRMLLDLSPRTPAE